MAGSPENKGFVPDCQPAATRLPPPSQHAFGGPAAGRNPVRMIDFRIVPPGDPWTRMRQLFVAILLTLPPALAAPAAGQSSPAADQSDAAPGPQPEARGGTGLAVPGSIVGLPAGLRSATPGTPCYLLVSVGRAEVENPGALEPILAQARDRGLRVVIRLLDTEWDPVALWTARLLAFARALGDQVVAYQFLGPGADLIPPQDYAFLLKNARVAIRSGGSWAPIVSAPFGRADEDWADQIFAADAGPYLDALAARNLDDLPAVESVRELSLPRAALWVTDQVLVESGPGAEAVRVDLEAHDAGADVVIFIAPPESPPSEAAATAAPQPEPVVTPAAPAPVPVPAPPPVPAPAAGAAAPLGEVLSFLRSQFPPGLRRANPGILPFRPDAVVEGGGVPEPRPVAIKVLAFFEADTRDGIAAYRAAPPAAELPGAAPQSAAAHAAPRTDRVRVVLRSPVESLDLLYPDRAYGRTLAAAAAAGSVVELPLHDGYMLLRYRLAASALPVKEQAQVGAKAELTAEEIIAREREMRGVQETRYQHYEANAAISIHYRLAALNETIDLTTDNRVYFKDGRQDYEQTALYVNGALWRGKSPPYLPYLQPANVNEVPLDVSLDERYRYTLVGRRRVDA